MIKAKIYTYLNFPYSKEIGAKLLTVVIIFISIIYGVITILETELTLYLQFYIQFNFASYILGIFIVIELILRIWSNNFYPHNEDYDQLLQRHMGSLVGLIDITCVMSFVFINLSYFFPVLIDITRFLRLFSFFKIFRYSTFFKVVISVLKLKTEELIITFVFSLILLFIGSFLIYIAKHEAQPAKIPNLFSAMWFTAINLFTIGYGDIIPITTFGKTISGVISLLGITLFLLPISVVVSGFLDLIEERKPPSEKCLNCQETIHKSKFIKKRKLEMVEIRSSESPNSIPVRIRLRNAIQFRFPHTSTQTIVFVIFMLLIILNLLAIMVETNPPMLAETKLALDVILIVSIVVFSIE